MRLGDSKETLLKQIGDPDAVSVTRKGPQILRFGRLQVQLMAGAAAFISLTWDRQGLVEHPGIAFEGWIPEPEMPLDSFRAALFQMNIGFDVDARVTLDFQTTLNIRPSGVRVVFSDGFLDKKHNT